MPLPSADVTASMRRTRPGATRARTSRTPSQFWAQAVASSVTAPTATPTGPVASCTRARPTVSTAGAIRRNRPTRAWRPSRRAPAPMTVASSCHAPRSAPRTCTKRPPMASSGPMAAARPSRTTAAARTGSGTARMAAARAEITLASASTPGARADPTLVSSAVSLVRACVNLKNACRSTSLNALCSSSRVTCASRWNTPRTESASWPSRFSTPTKPRTLSVTDASACALPPNLLRRTSRRASSPCSRRICLSCSPLRPTARRVCSASRLGWSKSVNTARRAVTASSVPRPARVITARAAATWSNETPIVAATGTTRPMAPASASASALPSRTAARRMPVARPASMAPCP
jgi:hypothetical protein